MSNFQSVLILCSAGNLSANIRSYRKHVWPFDMSATVSKWSMPEAGRTCGNDTVFDLAKLQTWNYLNRSDCVGLSVERRAKLANRPSRYKSPKEPRPHTHQEVHPESNLADLNNSLPQTGVAKGKEVDPRCCLICFHILRVAITMGLEECCFRSDKWVLHTKAFRDEGWQELSFNWIKLLSVAVTQRATLCILAAVVVAVI